MKEVPVIYITPPEVVSNYETIANGATGRIIYNYDNSHLFYKGMDLGKISDLVDIRYRVDKAIERCKQEISASSIQYEREHKQQHLVYKVAHERMLKILKEK